MTNLCVLNTFCNNSKIKKVQPESTFQERMKEKKTESTNRR